MTRKSPGGCQLSHGVAPRLHEFSADRVERTTDLFARTLMPDAHTVQPPRALYYPHFQFGSTAWVKSALLYWEGLVRSRPPQSSPQDDPEITQLIEAGLIEDRQLEPLGPQIVPEIGERVEELMREHGGELPPGIPEIGHIRGSSVEQEKREHEEILDDLRGYPLAQQAFAQLDRACTLLYTFGIEKVANALGFSPVTDDPVFNAIAMYFEHERITQDPRKLTESDGHAIAQLVIPTPSLQAIAELPIERLLEIRRKCAAQRYHFREQVQSHLAAIAELPTPQAMEESLRAFQHETCDDFEAAREAVRETKARERWALLGISGPASLAAGAGVAAAASPLVGSIEGIGALAFGLTSWFMQKRAGTGASANHYLLALDAAVTSPWHGLTHTLRGLVHE
jgi:hypothetical protein